MNIFNRNIKNKGFTLIELLVVVAIIGLLSSIVLASLRSARNKAGVSRAKQDMRTFIGAVSMAQGESSKTLMTMSSNGGSTIPNCSMCAASCVGDIKNSSGVCYTNWVAVLSGVQMNAGGLAASISALNRDPWGSPYLVDENQGEGGAVNCSNVDTIKSVGPDGTNGTADDVSSPIAIPLSATCP